MDHDMISTRNRSIISLLILMALIVGFGRLGKLLEIKTVEAAQLPELKEENQLLKDKLETSSKIETPEKIKQVARVYLKKYFGKEAGIVEQVMTCESGLNNLSTHINKDGSKDMGLYQIHDEPVHRNNFQKMYGVALEIGAYDFELASKYAKFLWDRSPRNWVCFRLVANR